MTTTILDSAYQVRCTPYERPASRDALLPCTGCGYDMDDLLWERKQEFMDGESDAPYDAEELPGGVIRFSILFGVSCPACGALNAFRCEALRYDC